ncbi:MAG: recombinase family protein [Lachnospiraceae bacterium]|nr:recombinase family protein [Lachnospiraceae bacterium]
MRKKIRKMDCIEYLSVQAPLEKVNMLEDRQSRYIHDFVKRSEFHIVGKIRRNGFSQRDVDRQWMQIVNMIRKKQISGVVVANMAAVSSSLADAYYKVGLIIEAGGVVATVDEGRLDMHIKEVS